MNMVEQKDHGIHVERMSALDLAHGLPEEADALIVKQGLPGVGDNREEKCSAQRVGASVPHREECTSGCGCWASCRTPLHPQRVRRMLFFDSREFRQRE